MILKVLIADCRTGDIHHPNVGFGKRTHAVERIFTGFDDVEFGGPVWVGPDVSLEESSEDDAFAKLRDQAFNYLTTRVPDDTPGGWGACVNLLSRFLSCKHVNEWRFEAPFTLPNPGILSPHKFWAHWVKMYHYETAPNGVVSTVGGPTVVLHDAKAFLCDDKGQTIERLGPPA